MPSRQSSCGYQMWSQFLKSGANNMDNILLMDKPAGLFEKKQRFTNIKVTMTKETLLC